MMPNEVPCRTAPRSGARSSGCSSCSSVDVSIRRRLVAMSAMWMCLWCSAVVSAQTEAAPDPSDPFFDDTVLHEIRLAINSKDWETLKANYLANDYYPCDFRWG